MSATTSHDVTWELEYVLSLISARSRLAWERI
jgi:hypothetical protein